MPDEVCTVNDDKGPCIFPFSYQGRTFENCTYYDDIGQDPFRLYNYIPRIFGTGFAHPASSNFPFSHLFYHGKQCQNVLGDSSLTKCQKLTEYN